MSFSCDKNEKETINSNKSNILNNIKNDILTSVNNIKYCNSTPDTFYYYNQEIINFYQSYLNDLSNIINKCEDETAFYDKLSSIIITNSKHLEKMYSYEKTKIKLQRKHFLNA